MRGCIAAGCPSAAGRSQQAARCSRLRCPSSNPGTRHPCKRKHTHTRAHASARPHHTHCLLLQEIDEAEGVASVHEAFRRGINFFDTSPFYGGTKSEAVRGGGGGKAPQ